MPVWTLHGDGKTVAPGSAVGNAIARARKSGADDRGPIPTAPR